MIEIKINNLKKYINENFLIALTNKGVYKRAIKDLDNLKDKINIEDIDDDYKLKINIEMSSNENIEVILNYNDIKLSKCICPSKDICKHIIIALLYIDIINKLSIDKKIEDNNEKSDINEKNNNYFDEIKNISLDKIKKNSSKKDFEYALYKFYENIEININENDMLEISIPDENVNIYFPNKDSIEKSVCSCGEHSLCFHKILAILKYKEIYNKLEEIKEESREVKSIDNYILNLSKEFIENIFEKGFYSCSEKDFDIAEQISIKLQAKNMPEISKMFRSIASSIEAMKNKNASFNKIFVLDTLTRLYNTINKIEKCIKENNNDDIKSLTGEIRSKYILKKNGDFLGLGAYPFITSTGYLGISAYLYNINSNIFHQFSYVTPTFYDNSNINFEEIIKVYKKKTNFQNNISIEELSKYKLTFINYKVNKYNRISSSKETFLTLSERIDYKFLENIKNTNNELFANDYEDILNINFKYDYFNRIDKAKIIITEFQKIDNINFKEIEQILYFDIAIKNNFLSKEKRLTLSIKYNHIHSNGIKYIMNYKNNSIDKNKFMLLEINKYYIHPISIINMNAVINIFTEDTTF